MKFKIEQVLVLLLLISVTNAATVPMDDATPCEGEYMSSGNCSQYEGGYYRQYKFMITQHPSVGEECPKPYFFGTCHPCDEEAHGEHYYSEIDRIYSASADLVDYSLIKKNPRCCKNKQKQDSDSDSCTSDDESDSESDKMDDKKESGSDPDSNDGSGAGQGM